MLIYDHACWSTETLLVHYNRLRRLGVMERNLIRSNRAFYLTTRLTDNHWTAVDNGSVRFTTVCQTSPLYCPLCYKKNSN